MSRTVTTRLTTFNLPSPNQASLTFSSNPAAIKIIVPEGSQWCMPLHWHVDDAFSCTSVRCLSGHLRVYTANERTSGDFLTGPGGRAVTFKQGELVTWCSSRKLPGLRTCAEEWGVVFVVPDQNLYRNINSAILDREIYPQLSSTPLWLKLLFYFLRAFPRAREALLSFLLWVQLQTILYAHGFHEYHGRIDLCWPWTGQVAGGERPPQWVYKLQLRIQYLIAKLVMGSCYWLGNLMLGMKDRYPEYTLPPQAPRHMPGEVDEKDVGLYDAR